MLTHLIDSLDVYLERRKTRMYVGQLTKEVPTYVFTYNEQYLRAPHIIPLGVEFPLTKRQFKSTTLFASLSDRIPSRRNPAYPEYCHTMGIAPSEENPIVLLATIGKRGPSSFVFSPVFRREFTAENVRALRTLLEFTTREFAQIFEIAQASLNALERKRSSGKDLLKRLEIIVKFPQVALYLLSINSGFLPYEKFSHANKILEKKAEVSKDFDINTFL